MKKATQFKKIALIFFVAIGLLQITAIAQYKVQTFSKFKKNGAKQDTPLEFLTTFKLKSPIFVWLTLPDVPNPYEGTLYKLADGKEIIKSYFEFTHFKDINNNKPTVSFANSLGLADEPGEYKVTLRDNKTKKIVAETNITVTGEVAASSLMPQGSIVLCDDTDDKLNPIKPVTNNTISRGDGINLLAKLNKGIGARFYIWAIYKIADDGDEKPWKDWQVDVDNEKWTLFATSEKIYFTEAGKYAIYMLKQNATNIGLTVGNHKDYYAKTILTVK